MLLLSQYPPLALLPTLILLTSCTPPTNEKIQTLEEAKQKNSELQAQVRQLEEKVATLSRVQTSPPIQIPQQPPIIGRWQLRRSANQPQGFGFSNGRQAEFFSDGTFSWEGAAGTFKWLDDGRLKLEFHSLATMVIVCRPTFTTDGLILVGSQGEKYTFDRS